MSAPTVPARVCQWCGELYAKPRYTSVPQFELRRFCSTACAASGREAVAPAARAARLAAASRLVESLAEHVAGEGWMASAACGRDAEPDLWFGEQRRDPRGAALARRVCGGCPVRRECLEDALSRKDRWGIWGGFDYVQRAAIARTRLGGV